MSLNEILEYRYRDIFFENNLPILSSVLERGVFSPLQDQESYLSESENRQKRLSDLVSLLKVFYWIEQRNYEIYFSIKKDNPLDTFRIYVSKVVVLNFPFKEFQIGEMFKSTSPIIHSIISSGEYAVEDKKWDEWIDLLIAASLRKASWTPNVEYSQMSFSQLIYTRSRRLYDLACLLEEIYKIYCNDTEKIYGKKGVMFGFIGQYIVRQFPFKDYVFYSDKFQDKKNGIYEHWTPMAHFAKIIFLPKARLDDYKTDLTRKGWFEMLYYFYRTIYIHIEEDKDLNKTKDKTFRKKEAYSQIKIAENKSTNGKKHSKLEMDPSVLFDKMHDLEIFYSNFIVDETGIKRKQ